MSNKYYLFLLLILWSCHNKQPQTIEQLVKVGNHHLNFQIIQGKGLPMLFESGNGEDGSVWAPILQPLHASTGATLITYDRAGLGKSGLDTNRISFQQEIKDLNKALQQLGFDKDYFLVAHSFGGMYASEFSQINPGKVKGAVFIEVSTPCNLDM